MNNLHVNKEITSWDHIMEMLMDLAERKSDILETLADIRLINKKCRLQSHHIYDQRRETLIFVYILQ